MIKVNYRHSIGGISLVSKKSPSNTPQIIKQIKTKHQNLRIENCVQIPDKKNEQEKNEKMSKKNEQIKRMSNKINELNEQLDKYMKNTKEFSQIIEQLEESNQYLSVNNIQLKNEISIHEEQKIILSQKIQFLQQKLNDFIRQYVNELQDQATNRTKSTNETQLASTIHTQIDKQGPLSQIKIYKRNIIRQHIWQDYQNEAKHYKNQLHVQKMKTRNMQRIATYAYQSAKAQSQVQIRVLVKKVQNLKEELERKKLQIKQKDSIIDRFIMRK